MRGTAGHLQPAHICELGTTTAPRVTCRRGFPLRSSALARTTSGSRGSGGRASCQSRSCRALGLRTWIRFTATSWASRCERPGYGEVRTVIETGSSRDSTSCAAAGRHPKVCLGVESSAVGQGHGSAAAACGGAWQCWRGSAASARLRNQAELVRPGNGLGAVGCAEFAKDVADVLLTVSSVTTSSSAMRGFGVPTALHGLLVKIRDLGLCLVSVRRLDAGGTGNEARQ